MRAILGCGVWEEQAETEEARGGEQ
jgi:hypothetical protein